MRFLRPRRTRIFRRGKDVSSSIFLLVFAGAAFFSVAEAWGSREFAYVALGAVLSALAMLLHFCSERVEVDDDEIRVYNGFGKRIGSYAWDRIGFYQVVTTGDRRTGWGIGISADDHVALPYVNDPYGLQRSIIQRLRPGALQSWTRFRRPSSQSPRDEVQEMRYRPANDVARLIVRMGFLALFGAVIGQLSYAVWVGNFLGFGIGLVIAAAILGFRRAFRSARNFGAGRRIGITSERLTVTEDGVDRSIAWKDLVLAERCYLPDFERQAFYVLLYDGQTSIAYREDWRHTETLLQYASAYAPEETVFVGFDALRGIRL